MTKIQLTISVQASLIAWHSHQLPVAVVLGVTEAIYKYSAELDLDSYELGVAWRIAPYAVEDFITLGWLTSWSESSIWQMSKDLQRIALRSEKLLGHEREWHSRSCPCSENESRLDDLLKIYLPSE